MNDQIIAQITSLLSLDLPNTANDAKTNLSACMKLTGAILMARVNAQKKLATEKDRLRHPKEKDLTDLDRSIMLGSAVAEFQADYELLSGLESLLSERISVLKLLI